MNFENTVAAVVDYDEQVAALRDGAEAERCGDLSGVQAALGRFCIAAGIGDEILRSMLDALSKGASLIKTTWAETGACPGSLFAFLPGCQHCLTQAKSAYGLGAESDWFADNLALMGNPLIPTAPERISVEMLPEFARLQLEAKRLAGHR